MTWEIFLLLSLFGIKHFIADFPLQFQYMVKEKGTYGAVGGLHHSFLHASFTFLVLIPFCGDSMLIILMPLLDFVAHYHIDWAKQQLNRGLTMKDYRWWTLLGLDQCLHYLTYVGIIYVVTG